MLRLIDVEKIYTTKAGDTAALKKVNLDLPETGMIFITGKSGSGKTTMLNIIGGLDGLTSGEVMICGKKFSEMSDKEYDSYRNTFVGFIFQEYNLLPEYADTVVQVIAGSLSLGNSHFHQLANAVLIQLGEGIVLEDLGIVVSAQELACPRYLQNRLLRMYGQHGDVYGVFGNQRLPFNSSRFGYGILRVRR